MKEIYLMCGVPGSGKSTFTEKFQHGNSITISRDKIRYSFLADDDSYFAFENEVFKTFIKEINTALSMTSIDTIFIDATHLNEKSRNKVLDKLNLSDNVFIYAVSCETPLDVCIMRQENRAGRAKVPAMAIENMWSSFRVPRMDEKYKYNYIFHVDEDGKIMNVECR